MTRKGFTLLELLIVIVIIGILASIAIPRYVDVRNRAEAVQPQTMLASMRWSVARYYAENYACTTTPGDLDIGVPITDPNWGYTISSCTDDTDYEVTATKKVAPNKDTTIVMDQDGVISSDSTPAHPGI